MRGAFVKQKLEEARDWIPDLRVCWLPVRLLRYVPLQLDESAALEDLAIGAGHPNKWHECPWRRGFDWDLSRLLLGWHCESYGTATLAGPD